MKTYFKIIYTVTVVLFVGILVFPYLNGNLNFIKEEKGNENRTKIVKPVFNDTLAGRFFNDSLIEQYFKNYDDYYTDNFNLRQNFIKILNQFQYSFLNVSSAPNTVTIGKDGWFYESKSALNYKGANLFTDKEVEAYRNELLKRTKWAKRRRIKYYLVLVPNKMFIYPEHLPDQIIKISNLSRYDQIVKLNNDSTINVIDVRKNLLLHKHDGYDLYQRTDDHWNELGAYYGYQEILKRLSKDFWELKPMPLDDFKIEIEERIGGNMANMLDVSKETPEHFVKLTEKYQPNGHNGIKKGYSALPGISPLEAELVTENEKAPKLKCLIIRDSFTLLMMKFLKEHFSKCVFIHDAFMFRMREDMILKEKPDIILTIALETRMHEIINIPFTLSADQEIEKPVNILASNGKYVTTDREHRFIANVDKPFAAEKYMLVNYGNNECAFLTWDNFFLRSDLGHVNEIIGDGEIASDWARFKIVDAGDGYIGIKAANGKFLSLDVKAGQFLANKEVIGKDEKFKIEDAK
jgi:hypothetical protein